jgi:putative peptide zinc metalloprotease protein
MGPAPSAADASSARPVPLRKRPDLLISRQRYQGVTSWVVKDPAALTYFRFKDEEYFLLCALDGDASLEDIQRGFQKRFAPARITLEALQHFIGSLHRSGLVISDASGQGDQLQQRSRERHRRARWGRWLNILAIRFRGIDPTGILNATYPLVSWLYRPTMVAACCLFMTSAALLVAVQFDVFLARLPAFHDFFGASNILWLMVALSATKVLHEFGHGWTCRHFGGECHEMGVMLLVLTPCLYCNVSDSWMLPNKWHRAAIGAAGMYVELILAAIATYVWWFSEPGLLNQLALSVMFVSSVSTVVFNANPLMRYDGYYILADLLEIPNLRQKASRILTRFLARWCLGIKPPPDTFLPWRHQLLFGLYGVLSTIYRWLVLFSILWFLSRVFAPYRLQIIGQLIAVASIVGLIGVPGWHVVQFFRVPGRLATVKFARCLLTAGLVGGILAVACLWPLPYRVFCPVEVRPLDAAPVYVQTPGTLEAVYLRPGQPVDSAETPAVLARLANPDLDIQIAELRRQLEEAQAHVRALEIRRTDDAEVGKQIPSARETVAAVERQLAEAHKKREQLLLVAPQSGTILRAPEVPVDSDNNRLDRWSGTPLHDRNLGCYLQTGDLFCLVADPKRMEAVLAVDESDVEFVATGTIAEILLDQAPDQILQATIYTLSKSDLKEAPRSMTNRAGGDLPTRPGQAGNDRPLTPVYQALARFDNKDGRLRVGLRGYAKIDAGNQTLAARLYRYLCRTFRIEQ